MNEMRESMAKPWNKGIRDSGTRVKIGGLATTVRNPSHFVHKIWGIRGRMHIKVKNVILTLSKS